MKTFLRRGISIVIATLMLFAVFAGCSQTTDSDTTETNNSNQSVTEKKEEAKATEEVSNFNETGLPVFNNPVTYRVMVPRAELAKKSFDEKDIMKKYSQETNVMIEWEEVPRSTIAEKLNIVVNSGSTPDALMAWRLEKPVLIESIEAGLLVPISDYSQYTPNLQKALDARPVIKKLITYLDDGKYYYYPGHSPRDHVATRAPLFINKQWLDNLGLEEPTTTEEYYNVLKAFKEQDANGNGDNDDEIPVEFADLGFLGLGYDFLELFGAWGIQGARNGCLGSHNNGGETTIRDGKLYFHQIEDAYRDALTYFHTLYAEGLMDPESITQEWSSVNSKLNSEVPIVGSYLGWSLPGVNPDQYIALDPLIGPKGDQYAIMNPSVISAFAGLTIFSNCEQPEGLIRWVDHMNEGTNAIELYAGPEGGIWDVNEADKSWYIDDEKVKAIGVSSEEYRQTEGVQNGPSLRIEAVTGYKEIMSTANMNKLEWTKRYEPYYFPENWPNSLPLAKATEEDEEMIYLWNDMGSYLKAFVASAVIDGVTDEQWEKHIAECETLQYEKILAYLQSKYDTTK